MTAPATQTQSAPEAPLPSRGLAFGFRAAKDKAPLPAPANDTEAKGPGRLLVRRRKRQARLATR